MNENGDFLARVLDEGKNGGGDYEGGKLGGELGFGEDEIMVEIVGCDVFVDGVSGNETNGNVGNGNCGGFMEEEVGVEDYGVTEDVVFLESGDSGFGRYSGNVKAEEVSEEVKERGLDDEDRVVVDIVVDVESRCLESVRSMVKRVYVETDASTASVNAEPVDQQTEGVGEVSEMVNKKEESLCLGNKIVESDVDDGNLKCLEGEGLVENNLVTERSGDRVNVSVDSVSSQKPAELVVDSQVADDDDKVSCKGVETSKGVDFGEGKGDCGEGIQTSLDLVSTIEHTQVVADYDEALYNKVSTVNDIEISTNESFLSNPMSEVSEIKSVQCEQKYADAEKDCERALISERNFEEATDYKASKADASGVSIGVCGGDNGSVEATEVLDLKADPTARVNRVSGCSKEVQNTNRDPGAERSDLPTLEENSQRQGLVSETGLVEHMKVVESLENYVGQEQHDIGIVSEGIVEASVETISDEKMDYNSKPRVVDGDMNLVKDTNLSGLDSRGSDAVNEEKRDDMLKPDIKLRGSLGSEDDENKILDEPFTGEILNKGDTDSAIPHRVGDVTYGSEAVLSSAMLHREGKAVHYFRKDVPIHLPDCNWNSIVNVMSDGVTSDELLHLTFQKGKNEAITGSLVDRRSALCNEEEKKVQGSHLDGNLTLSYELNCVDSNVQGTEKNHNLQDSECLDASSTSNHTGVSSDKNHILEVKYDEEQVDVRTDQELEIQDKTKNIEESEVVDEKIAEQVSPRSASSISEFHSCYLLPPKNEGEFSVGDLVWSKDRNLPWWPGQIFDPADASEKAMKHRKNDCFLVAYFGIRTFSWNDKSQIRPFKTHFSHIEEQGNSEAYHEAINCALVEVTRRVQLGLACSCLPKNYVAEIESQTVENIGIHHEAGRRFRVDESTAAFCFEPRELLEHIRSLALLPSAGCDNQLQLTISKAQVAAFSRFKGQHPLPEFHFCDGLLETDANTSILSDAIQEHSAQVKGEHNTSSKRKHDLEDDLPPRKKGSRMSEFISDLLESDGEEEDRDIRVSSVARKKKAFKSLIDGSGKIQTYYAAKVSTTASHTPKKSFKVGDSILKVASQLTESPSHVKCNSEKFVETDDSVDQHHGFDCLSQTSVNSQQGMMLLLKNSSINEMLSQLHLVAQDPMNRYSFLNEITSFFSGFRQSVIGQNSRKRNQRIGQGSGKKKAPQTIINPPEDFEFDDVNDSYWADMKVQNYDEEQILDRGENGEAENLLVPTEADIEQILVRGQNEEAENQLVPNEADKEQILDTAQYGEATSQLVPSEADKPVRSGQRSRKRFSSGKQVMVAEEPVVDHTDIRRPDCSPTDLILKFTEGKFVPSELDLNKIFRRFGPIRELETEIDRESSSAKVVYKRCSDAKVALSSAGLQQYKTRKMQVNSLR
ncbi:hypothetical protein POM88_020161 [Heracleum sosnowskyi]|uniref:PWWP domain-containing protein n=1 Tax=Heracleum sosnowskyi TaxID=360622 RepID=A0AAD8MR74_9APIA|nr:hypothetical protein POM88_020161 [Heracleum sosnowskyi]